jgi:hypothetical protein
VAAQGGRGGLGFAGVLLGELSKGKKRSRWPGLLAKSRSVRDHEEDASA